MPRPPWTRCAQAKDSHSASARDRQSLPWYVAGALRGAGHACTRRARRHARTRARLSVLGMNRRKSWGWNGKKGQGTRVCAVWVACVLGCACAGQGGRGGVFGGHTNEGTGAITQGDTKHTLPSSTSSPPSSQKQRAANTTSKSQSKNKGDFFVLSRLVLLSFLPRGQ